ncbi:MAG: NAD(P)H-hydrate dehydratase [archaeon]|nr:NAD(P)H-hydrate dehydratase [archaeon]
MPKTITETKVKKFFKKRKTDSHKGDNGIVLVIGGSTDLIGAPALAGMSTMACLRTGIDLCIIASPEKAGLIINSFALDLIVKKFKGDFFTKKHLKKINELEKKADSVLIGPGIGKEKQTNEFVKEFVQKNRKPLVIDADAIKACAGMKFNGAVLLTPHEKEFEIFSGKKLYGKNINEKIKLVKETSLKHKCIILLKGKTDIISDGKKTTLNKTGNAGMTVAGTGDSLAGLCVGFNALGLDLFQAAEAGAFVNGKIGDLLYKKMGYSYIASDFAKEVPYWIKKLLN